MVQIFVIRRTIVSFLIWSLVCALTRGFLSVKGILYDHEQNFSVDGRHDIENANAIRIRELVYKIVLDSPLRIVAIGYFWPVKHRRGSGTYVRRQ